MINFSTRAAAALGVLGLLSVGFAAPASAQDASTANEMIANCKMAAKFSEDPANLSDQDMASAAFCMGWAQGMMDGVSAANDDLKNAAGVGRFTAPHCIEDTRAAIGDVVVAFLNYAEANPDTIADGEGQMMFEALAKTFPCNRN